MNRKRFLISSSTVALAACSAPQAALAPTNGALPLAGLARGAPVTRLEITEFSRDAAMVAAFRKGVAMLRANRNARSVTSWNYWHFSHWMPYGKPPRAMETVWDQCRHGVSYFFAWHRGYLVYFERMIRQLSGNSKFALPYWDYYTNPTLPPIFTDPTLSDGSPNPLYWADRKGTVITGLSYAPYAPTVTTFPFGPGRTYENLVEPNPHGHVHDQIGGSMGRVPTAAADPIFWVHHSNIDRLWTAWLAAGGHRKMPDPSRLWWDQTFYYNLSRTWRASVRQMNDTRNLGYRFSDVSLPVRPAGAMLPARPALASAGSLNTFGPIALDLQPVTLEIPLDARLLNSPSLEVRLEDVALTDAGAQGGYDVGVYANLPESPVSLAEESTFFLGELGAFGLTMPRMQMPGKAVVRFDLAHALRRQSQRGLAAGNSLLLSFAPLGHALGLDPKTKLARIARIIVTA
jgi:tyrosinase